MLYLTKSFIETTCFYYGYGNKTGYLNSQGIASDMRRKKNIYMKMRRNMYGIILLKRNKRRYFLKIYS